MNEKKYFTKQHFTKYIDIQSISKEFNNTLYECNVCKRTQITLANDLIIHYSKSDLLKMAKDLEENLEYAKYKAQISLPIYAICTSLLIALYSLQEKSIYILSAFVFGILLTSFLIFNKTINNDYQRKFRLKKIFSVALELVNNE
ncbi:hypothetical protein [Jeotgalibacillus malaysiensis]|uniref:hypothetical protein n=1 Tax=Jeotgalibacillus malaysiensis TaxID=1508404 RepID=UPI003850A61C